jgi:dihydrofolate synthase/folylpolyglutamate synthase
LHPKVIDLTLDRVEVLLARLGDPHHRLPPVVHVAGTNGKGSVIAFMRAFLEAGGYRVHAYTSPHLVDFNERIVLAGVPISDVELSALLDECEDANGGDPITFFEITTAAAFLAYASAPADVLLLETGLGGRFDATNVIHSPALTVLTPISIDHQQYLGDTLAEIVGEKLGILRPGVDCVSALQPPDAIAWIDDFAGTAGVPLLREGRDWSVQAAAAGGLAYSGPAGKRQLPRPALAGDHQLHNAGLAIACLDRLDGLNGSDADISTGLGSVRWPARLQRIASGSLAAMLPAGWELWLDGGHNPAAAEVLSAHAEGWRGRPLHLIFGMLSSKDPAEFLAPFAASAGLVRTVAIPGEASSLSAEDAAEAGRAVGLASAPAAGLAAALADITASAREPARVLICGSLYLAGAVLRDF